MDKNQQSSNDDKQKERFESDTSKLTRLHMADPDHVITDEDMQNIRVGMSPGPDVPTQEAVEDAEDRVADKKSDNDDDTLPGAQKMTPWNVVE